MTPAAPMTVHSLRATLDRAIAETDRVTAVRSVCEAVTSDQLDVPTVYTMVLEPLLVDTGIEWQHGATAVWQEHYATAIVRTIVESLYIHVAEKAAVCPKLGKTILLACPAEEAHDLGLRMLADRLMLAGWDAHFLGADTPTSEIAAAARAFDADVVALSAATHYNRVLLRSVLERLKSELPGVRIGVGGRSYEGDDFNLADRLTLDELGLDASTGA